MMVKELFCFLSKSSFQIIRTIRSDPWLFLKVLNSQVWLILRGTVFLTVDDATLKAGKAKC